MAAIGGVSGCAKRFPAHGTCRGCPERDATAPVDRAAALAHHLNGPSNGGAGDRGQGSVGGRLASKGHPRLHWSARGCAGAGGHVQVGGAPAHVEVPQACCYRDTHSGLAASPPQPPPCAALEGAGVLNPSRWCWGRGGGGALIGCLGVFRISRHTCVPRRSGLGRCRWP